MTINNAVNSMAGFFIVCGLAAAHFSQQIDLTQPGWLWLVAFVGINLFQMGFTGFCPAALIFRRLGIKDAKGTACSS